MFTLSKDPYKQRVQLIQLLERSAIALLTLTAPVEVFTEDELIKKRSSYWGDGKLINDYSPPPTRYGKLNTSYDFND